MIRLGLCSLLIALSPGPEAWATVVRVQANTATAVVPGAAAGLGGVGAPLHTAGTLTDPSLRLNMGGVLPVIGTVNTRPVDGSVSRTQTVSTIRVPAAAPVTESWRKKGETVKRARRLAAQAAPELENIRDAAAAPGALYTSSRKLDILLTGGEVRASDASVPVHGREGRWNSPRHRLAHEGHDHFEDAEAAPGEGVPAPEITLEQKRRFSFYKYGVSAVKIGIEALHIALPLMVITQFGSVTALGAMVIGANLAGLASSLVSGPVIDRFGPARVLTGTALLQAAAIGAIPLLYIFGVALSLPLISGLYIASGALVGVFDIARRAEMPHILGRNEGTLREYNGRLYVWREIAAVGGDTGAGFIAKAAGFLASLVLHPVAYLFAAFQFFRLTRSSPKHERKKGSKEERRPLTDQVKSLFDGARIVLKDPALRTAALVNIPVLVLHQLFHTMLAAVYATQVLGNPMLAAVLIIAWNVGELMSAWYLKRYGKKERSFRWLRFGALAGLSAWLLWLLPSVWIAAPVTFLLATATLSGELGLASFFQSRSKQDKVGAVTGFVYSLSTGFSMAALYGMGKVFDTFAPSTGFLILAAVLSAVSVFYLISWMRLRNLSEPPAQSSLWSSFTRTRGGDKRDVPLK